MTSMNRDTDYANLAQAIRFAIRQSLKDLYTCMPGIVESYDAETRRAVVKGALNIVTTNRLRIKGVSGKRRCKWLPITDDIRLNRASVSR